MICVSIGRGRHRHVIAEHKHLVEQGAQLVELRLDYINGQINLKRVLTDRPSPVIVTIRRQQDGGKYNGGEEARLMLLRTAIAEGVEYVDLEEDIATRFRATARPSGSSACTTFARRPTTWTRSTPGWRCSTPTSSRSRRWPISRTTICGCCDWCATARFRQWASAWGISARRRGC